MYMDHATKQELVKFEEFAAKFALAQVSAEELFAFYKLMRALTTPGPVPPALLAKCLNSIAGWKQKHYGMLYGQKIEIVFAQMEIEGLIKAMASIIVKYVPEKYREAALNELDRVGVGRQAEPVGEAGA